MFKNNSIAKETDKISQMMMNSTQQSHFLSRAHLKGPSKSIFQIDPNSSRNNEGRFTWQDVGGNAQSLEEYGQMKDTASQKLSHVSLSAKNLKLYDQGVGGQDTVSDRQSRTRSRGGNSSVKSRSLRSRKSIDNRSVARSIKSLKSLNNPRETGEMALNSNDLNLI